MALVHTQGIRSNVVYSSERFIASIQRRASVDIYYIVRNQALRIGSAVTRALEFTDSVFVIQLEEDEKERYIAEKLGAIVYSHEGWTTAPDVAKTLQDILQDTQSIIISLDNDWRLSELPALYTSARTAPDVLLAVKRQTESQDDKVGSKILEADAYAYSEVTIQHSICSKEGLAQIALQDRNNTPGDLTRDLRVLVVEVTPKRQTTSQQSLTTISGFSRLLYWMLESRHPLILFGIPGALFFWVGFQMADSLVDIGGPHDTVGVGVALAAFVTTFIGVFAITASMILFVLSKQVERIQAEFTVTLES